MSPSTFQALCKKLNPAQKEAVDTIEGPVMVVAGPGTGKTQILSLRIANILRKTDTPADAILALTFTESGVAAMRKRLVGIIGPQAYRVGIFTFHGFCNDIIQRYPEYFQRIIGSEPISDIEKIGIIRQVLAQGTFEYIAPFGNPTYYVNDIMRALSELKRENVTPEKLDAHTRDALATFEHTEGLYHEKGPHQGKMKGMHESTKRKIDRTAELATIYHAYQGALVERKRYDFDDMIMEVVSRLEKDQDLLLRIQEEYHYVLADEHQDANAAQNALLEMITSFHEQPNIFVVGDEKQAIFRFQGASIDNFFRFQKVFPGARLITLTEGYRSGQRILDVSQSMIDHDGVSGRVPLVSCAGVEQEQVEVHAFATREAESAWVVHEIQSLIGDGVEPSEIALLYRTNGEAERWVRACEDRGVLVSVESEQNALADPDIRKFIVFLRAVARLGDDALMSAVLHLPFVQVTALDAYKIMHAARKARVGIATLLEDPRALGAAHVAREQEARQLVAHMQQWAKAEGSIPTLIGDIIRDSGYLTFALNSPRGVELIEKLAGFTRDVEKLAAGKPDYALSELVADLALLDEYGVPITKEVRAAPRRGAVRLMTAHKSKGLEFDYVFITNGVDGMWGGRRSRSHFALPTGGIQGDDNDERRLLYVALTRARLRVCMSYPQERDGKTVLPSRFVEEMDERITLRVEHEGAHDYAADLARTRAQAHATLADKAFLNELFSEQGLSVTALNNFRACPWRYFYSNLIRIPLSPTPALVYGNAIDRALKRFFESYREHGGAEKEALFALVDDALRAQPISAEEVVSMQKRAREHLGAWFDAWQSTFVRETLSGYALRGEVPLKGELPRVLIRGELDKVEFLSNGEIRVVDYKTGKPKSRNAIMGLTKSDDGEYFRQLTFYKLLLQLEGKYRMDAGMLDFVQPDSRGKLHREMFVADELDERALTEEIDRVAQAIWSLSFWSERCEDSACQYCQLRDMMA